MTPGPLTIDVDLPSGSLDVCAEESDQTSVDVEPMGGEAAVAAAEAAEIDLQPAGEGHELRIRVPQRRGLLALTLGRDADVAVRIRCPAGTTLRAKTRSADLVGC